MTLSWRGKRVLDIVVSVLAAPAVLVISVIAVIVIYITMGRPILFTQKRVGLGGRTFDIYKLRTMVAADGGACTTQRQDPRVTPLGALLRKFRIDELPQFINVLKGDMSLIGPRPEQPRLVEDYCRCIPRFAERHRVKPGITGLAQVRYQYASDAAETRNKLRYDLIYVRRQSVVLDLWILLCTTGVILKGFGAR